jgi:hypothetical protein
VNTSRYAYGLAVFDVRGAQFYPTASNDGDDYGLPVLEIR